ncbi:hypothetical protein ACOSP7_017004 [Xanthoceras sorbifolium]
MPSGDESTLEALKYAACDCHRNFHRKEIYKEIPLSMDMYNPSSPIVAPMNVAFGGVSGTGTESSSEDLNVFQSNNADGVLQPPLPPAFVLSKKHFRTKFTQEQKDKMLEYAEKIGWHSRKKTKKNWRNFMVK